MRWILNKVKYILLIIFLIIGLSVLIFSIKFYKAAKIVEIGWEQSQVDTIKDVGSIKSLSIIPLVESNTKSDNLIGEPGVSYLIKADGKNILFDLGWNMKKEEQSPLLKNMDELGVTLNQINSIFISHNHPDHTGGKGIKGSFALSEDDIKLTGVRAYIPLEMTHESASVEVIKEPKKIVKGIVSIGPISRAIWLAGIVEEQSLAINLEGKGIVLIVGCGHPSIERIVKRAEDLFAQPIYGVIGGLHYPITNPVTLKSIGQKILGPKYPWQRYKKSEVKGAIRLLTEKDLKVVGISSHDSCDWTIKQFRDSFDEKYREVVVGEEIKF